MNISFAITPRHFGITLCAALATVAAQAMAADFYWSGGSGVSDNIDQGANWWSGTNPSSGDNLYFNNTPGSNRQWPFCNYGSGSWFGNIIIYAGAQSIRWRGDQTYCYEFCNDNNAALIISEATLANRTGPDYDLILWPGGGGLQVNNIVLQNGRQLQINTSPHSASSTLTVMGAISQTGTGNATLALNTAATLILNSTATYAGDTYVNNGTLRLAANNALANSGNYLQLGSTSGSAAANVNLQGGLTLSTPINVRSGSSGTKTIANTASTTGTAAFAGNISLDANATLYANSGGAVAVTGSTADLKNQTLTIDGSGDSAISATLQNSTGSGKLTKKGSGILTLSGANTYAGATAIQNGTVIISGGDDRLPAGTTVTLGGSGGASGVLQLGDAGGARSQTLAGLGVATGAGTANAVVGGNAGISILTIDTTIADSTFSGTLGGTGANQNNLALLKTGPWNLNLNHANTFAGGVTVRAGSLYWLNNNALGANTVTLNDTGTGASAVSLLRSSSGTLGVPIVVANQGSGTTTIGADAAGSPVIYSGGITLYKALTLRAGTSGDMRITTVGISGSAPVTVTGTAPAQVVMNVANTYSGDTRVSAAMLLLGTANALQNSTLDLNAADSGSAAQGSGVTALTVGGLKGTRNWSLDEISVSVGNNSQDTTYSGYLRGTMSLTKIGAGRLILSGTTGSGSPYTGSTTVSQGTLEASHGTVLAGSTSVSVNGGTLALTGSGALNSAAQLSIAAGGTFNVSALASPYAFGATASLSASGTGTTVGSSAAAIVGAPGGIVSLGTRPIALAYNGSQPALYVSQGTMRLQGNAWTINGSTLGAGTYAVGRQAAGTVDWSGTHTVGGSAIPSSGKVVSLSSSGTDIVLRILNSTTLTLTRPVGSSPSTYGEPLTFRAVVSPDPGNGSTITFKTNGVAIGTAQTTGGAADLAISTLPYSGGSAYTVSAEFAGDTSNAASTNTLSGGQQVNPGTAAGSLASSQNPSLPGATVTFTATVTNAVPGRPAPVGSVLFKTNGVPLCEPVLLDSNGLASLATNALPHGSTTLAAEFAGGGNFLGLTNSLVQVVNTPPTAHATAAGAVQGHTLVLSVAKLLGTASDADGDPLSLTAAGPTSTNGPAYNVVLNTSAGTITYTPAAGFTGSDAFTYTISDTCGGTANPTLVITVTSANVPSPNIVVPPAYDSGSGIFRVTFAGIPGCTYSVETATDPSGPWAFLKTAQAGPNGLFEVTDTQVPPPPARYYRTLYP